MHMIEIESEPELQVEQVTFEDVTNSFLEQGKPIASHHNPCLLSWIATLYLGLVVH
jgi:hypothetical protein